MIKLITHEAEETRKLGRTLGSLLPGGSLLCLNGDLGAGKTAFSGGIAEGLEIEDTVTSPTFTIVNEYSGRLPFFHFDVYRIDSPEEMFEIGFDEYLNSEGIIVIEWAERIRELLPAERLDITIKRPEDSVPHSESIREFYFKPVGEKYQLVLEKLRKMGWGL